MCGVQAQTWGEAAGVREGDEVLRVESEFVNCDFAEMRRSEKKWGQYKTVLGWIREHAKEAKTRSEKQEQDPVDAKEEQPAQTEVAQQKAADTPEEVHGVTMGAPRSATLELLGYSGDIDAAIARSSAHLLRGAEQADVGADSGTPPEAAGANQGGVVTEEARGRRTDLSFPAPHQRRAL